MVPFIRPYRVESDVQTWSQDPAIFAMIEEEYRRGFYRGIGEFHIFGQAAQCPLVRRTIDFATDRNLHVLAHCDDEALAIMLANHPQAKMTWAHTGFSTPVAWLPELLAEHPALMLELSYRSGITRNGGLAPEWRDLFGRYSDRFLLGSDTWINQRWIDYGTIMRGYREWLAELPADQATRIAYGNAERIYGGKLTAEVPADLRWPLCAAAVTRGTWRPVEGTFSSISGWSRAGRASCSEANHGYS